MPATTPSSGLEYVPPGFSLFEARLPDPGDETLRWIHGWNGLIGEPAADVTLGAKAPGGHALVTSAFWTSESHAQISALMAANSLLEAWAHTSAESLVNAALSQSDWTPASLLVDGQRVTVAKRTFMAVSVAYSVEDVASIAVAWRGDIAIARVNPKDSGDYPVDPFTPHSTSELAAQTQG